MRHNGRWLLNRRDCGRNRSKSGVWNIRSYESLRPVDSSSQSGNFLSRLNTYNSFPKSLLQPLQDCGEGRMMDIDKFGSPLLKIHVG
jgi:hypothetical protein